MKQLYVRGVRAARTALESTHLLEAMARSEHRSMRWLRSLFSIYDSNDMVALDVPWWTYAAVDKVSAFLDSRQGNARVFEYGAGASTVWLAKRAAEVVSVEHDERFWESMQPLFAKHTNVEVLLVPPATASGEAGEVRSERAGYERSDFAAYVSALDRCDGMFDLIIVDGRARNACLAAAMSHLSADGMIVFDNSNRRRYRQAIKTSGMLASRLRGLAPALPYPSETTLMRKPS